MGEHGERGPAPRGCSSTPPRPWRGKAQAPLAQALSSSTAYLAGSVGWGGVGGALYTWPPPAGKKGPATHVVRLLGVSSSSSACWGRATPHHVKIPSAAAKRSRGGIGGCQEPHVCTVCVCVCGAYAPSWGSLCACLLPSGVGGQLPGMGGPLSNQWRAAWPPRLFCLMWRRMFECEVCGRGKWGWGGGECPVWRCSCRVWEHTETAKWHRVAPEALDKRHGTVP